MVFTNSKLLIACWATVIVLILMALVFWRSKKNSYAVAVLPLTIPPLVHLISGILARGLETTLPFANPFQIRIVIDLIAAIVACVLIGIASQFLYETRKGRSFFAISCSAFIVVFSAILILTTISQYVASVGM